MSNIRKFIDAMSNNDTEVAKEAFKNAFMNKVKTLLDVKRVEVASSTYNKDNAVK